MNATRLAQAYGLMPDEGRKVGYDEYVEVIAEQTLADAAVMADLLADHWASHPHVGRLIYNAAMGSSMHASEAKKQLVEIMQRLAEEAACRQWQRMH